MIKDGKGFGIPGDTSENSLARAHHLMAAMQFVADRSNPEISTPDGILCDASSALATALFDGHGHAVAPLVAKFTELGPRIVQL